MHGGKSAAVLASGLAVIALGMARTPVAGALSPATGCAKGAIVREQLHAPTSEPKHTPFTVTVLLLNCTGAQQSLTLEGRQKAPGQCSAPVIDPLPVHLKPHQQFTLRDDIPGQSCTGTCVVTWSVVRGSTTLAERTAYIEIIADN